MFVKLTKRDDWGSESYWAPDGDKPYPLKDGQKVRVRFPDGIELRLCLRGKEVVNHVSDHGRGYTVVTVRFFVDVPVFGLVVPMEIDKIEIAEDQ